MTLAEACELARAIEGNGQFAVIAIGRFVLRDELSTTNKQTLPWKISVVSLSDRTDRAVIDNEAQWQAFAKAASGVSSQLANPNMAASSKPSSSKPRIEEEQLELF